MKIKLKLSFQFTAIVFSIILLFSLSIYFFSSYFRKVQFTNRLETKALTTAKLLFEVQEVDSVLLKIIDKNSLNILSEEKVIIYDSNFKKIYFNTEHDLEDISKFQLLEIKKRKRVLFSKSKTDIIGIVFKNNGNEFIVIASSFDKYGYVELKNLKIILLIGLLSSLLITFFAGLFFSRRAMSPIINVIKQVNNVNEFQLNKRVTVENNSDEIGQLALTFNKMLERLESAFENQKQFISNISHEIRTPLTSITGQIEVALLKKREQHEYVKLLQSLFDDIKDLNSLTNGLLELAQSQADINAFKIKKIRIDELLIQCKTEIQKRNNNNSVMLNFLELPEDEKSLTIFASEKLLKIALSNIIDNSCKFSSDNICNIELSFEEQYVRLNFIDKGIGIPENEINKIFAPFYRASNVSDNKGHGIGLSLVKKIIDLHKGKLIIISQLNIGTTISVLLPKVI